MGNRNIQRDVYFWRGMTHNTQGLVLRTVKYGETSIIATVYTELFGLQAYMVKGVRTTSRKGHTKAGYFQPGALLQLVVYHNELKNLQFIKEVEWAHLYNDIFYDVVKHAIALFLVELLLHSLKEPESNPELYDFAATTLLFLDRTNGQEMANLPIFIALQLAALLGFALQGNYSPAAPVLDLSEGFFVATVPPHHACTEGEQAGLIHRMAQLSSPEELSTLSLNKSIRRQLLDLCILYFSLHIADFGELRSMRILKEVL
jgi:DNA repair protein RecO (recombination protein O)